MVFFKIRKKNFIFQSQVLNKETVQSVPEVEEPVGGTEGGDSSQDESSAVQTLPDLEHEDEEDTLPGGSSSTGGG